MGDQWHEILTPEQIDAYHRTAARLDPIFAAADRCWWESRSEAELRAQEGFAWMANDPTSYQLARSYRAKSAGLVHRQGENREN